MLLKKLTTTLFLLMSMPMYVLADHFNFTITNKNPNHSIQITPQSHQCISHPENLIATITPCETRVLKVEKEFKLLRCGGGADQYQFKLAVIQVGGGPNVPLGLLHFLWSTDVRDRFFKFDSVNSPHSDYTVNAGLDKSNPQATFLGKTALCP